MAQEPQKKIIASKPLVWLWTVSGRNKWSVSGLLVVEIAQALLGVWQAWILRDLIDRAVSGDGQGFLLASLTYVGVVLVKLILRSIGRYLEEFSKSRLENRFKHRLYDALLHRDYAKVTEIHSEEWMNRLTSDTVVVANGVTEIVPNVTGMVVKLIAALMAVLVLVRGISWVIIPVGIVFALLTYFFRGKMKSLHKRVQEADGRLRVFLAERLSNLMIVRAYAKESVVLDGADAAMQEHRSARMRRNHYSNFCNFGFGILMHGAFAVAAIYCGYGILVGTMTYGTFTAVLQLVGQIQVPFADLSKFLPQYYAMLASAERLMEAEQFEPDSVGEKKDEGTISDFYRMDFAGIALKHVGFTYRARQKESLAVPKPIVLRDVNVQIRKGDAVAITGPSGCGKSTLLKLLMCLYPLNSGERCMETASDEMPLTAEWRGLFAYVPQGNQLMSGTIRSVISLGKTNLSEETIHNALNIACAEAFVNALPNGLDTELGEKGAGLSEGQMQRLAIARAILSEHPILLLDEATSSLDEDTEHRLLENLTQLTDRTILFVTHRTRILSICNREIRMQKDGVIVREIHGTDTL